MTVPEAAAIWQSHGVSVIPIVAKHKPAVRWREFQGRVATVNEVADWWGNGHQYGIAVICGEVSGNLEMTELEARALAETTLTDIANASDSLGCGDAWDRVFEGFTQRSPTGGLHLVYRIGDHDVPGNEKIAFDRSGPEPLVLAETRGTGGYFVGAPSPGSCHPSGVGWEVASGEIGVVPLISWDERQGIHAAIRQVLDMSDPHNPVPTGHPRSDPERPSSDSATLVVSASARPALASPGRLPDSAGASISPGDDWSACTDWADVLHDAGWEYHSSAGSERFWTRPGKDRKDGFSASTDYQGKPGLFVWSTSAGLPTEVPLTKLFVRAWYEFGGDMSACAKDLKRKGFGTQSQELALTAGELPDTVTESKVSEVPFSNSRTDSGNGMYLWQNTKDRFRYSRQENQIYVFDGIEWQPDYTGALVREWIALMDKLRAQATQDDDQALLKWATSSLNLPRINAAISVFKNMAGATMSANDMNTAPDSVNLINGEYNTVTRELEPHQAEHFMTRTVAARYQPEAQCPRWTQFMEQVLPDEATRRYVQRAVGYSLLGKADQRAFFLIYGPSGTGKSQFLSTLEYVFGSYAGTAAEGTFRAKEQGGITNDLHGLRGKRLVTTSETSEGAGFNETLMKRLTGRDSITSRELYQSNITWTPECAVWIATNHPPRFNSDDDAIWKRAKLVPFLTRFGTDAPEVPDFARKYLYAEADGILNWILEGLHDYLENGLGEPAGVLEAASQHREQSDSVVRFLEDAMAAGQLVPDPEGLVPTTQLYSMYEDWSRTSGERGLGSRRFMNRMESSGRAMYTRTSAGRWYKGLRKQL